MLCFALRDRHRAITQCGDNSTPLILRRRAAAAATATAATDRTSVGRDTKKAENNIERTLPNFYFLLLSFSLSRRGIRHRRLRTRGRPQKHLHRHRREGSLRRRRENLQRGEQSDAFCPQVADETTSALLLSRNLAQNSTAAKWRDGRETTTNTTTTSVNSGLMVPPLSLSSSIPLHFFVFFFPLRRTLPGACLPRSVSSPLACSAPLSKIAPFPSSRS